MKQKPGPFYAAIDRLKTWVKISNQAYADGGGLGKDVWDFDSLHEILSCEKAIVFLMAGHKIQKKAALNFLDYCLPQPRGNDKTFAKIRALIESLPDRTQRPNENARGEKQ